jgi:hypothetical protein
MSTLETNLIQPATGTTLTVGASGDTITIPSGATISNSGTASGFGKILQVINATFSTSTTSSSTSFADSGLTASITPSSASNKVLVQIALNGIERRDTLNWLIANVLRDTTEIISDFAGRAGYIQKYGSSDSDYHTGVGAAAVTYLDSPATTSSTTYKVQIKANAGSASAGICSVNSTSMITLMEVAS